MEYHVHEALLKGLARKLLVGASFLDKEGHECTEASIRWWEPALATMGGVLLVQGAPEGLDLDTPKENPDHPGYHDAAASVFFAHYCRTGLVAPVGPKAVGQGYSVAKKGGRLVVYRLCGEGRIQATRFVSRSLLAA